MKHFNLKYLQAAANIKQYPNSSCPEFAVIGRSNVGKSSLINTLAGGKKIARISKTPGKTRLLHFYTYENYYYLVDLPGYGFARVPIAERNRWDKMATEYLEQRQQLASVILLVDSRHSLTALDHQMMSWLQAKDKNFIIVATKIDKLNKNKLFKNIDMLNKDISVISRSCPIISFSSKSGKGKKELLKTLYDISKKKSMKKE